MEASEIRKKLHRLIDTIDDRKIEAVYLIYQQKMARGYSDDFKAVLDGRYEYYKNGGKMMTSEECDEEIKQLLKS